MSEKYNPQAEYFLFLLDEEKWLQIFPTEVLLAKSLAEKGVVELRETQKGYYEARLARV